MKLLLFALMATTLSHAFLIPAVQQQRRHATVMLRESVIEQDDKHNALDDWKKELLQLGASYDRGYGATPSARQKVEHVIRKLESMNPEAFAAKGIAGDDEASPLQGSWRMIWTTAQDVLVLAASPVATIGAIYQVFEPPIVTNIIDFLPKAQALFPSSLLPPSLLRAKVTTRASARSPNRVALDFEAVALNPVEFLGLPVDTLPPLAFDLPKLPGLDTENGPGYFDVTYLDEELLVIRQNAPGGIFCFVKTNDDSP